MAKPPLTAQVVVSHAASNPYYRKAMETAPTYSDVVALRARHFQEQRDLPGVPPVAAPTNAADDYEAWQTAILTANAAERDRKELFDAIGAEILRCNRMIESIADTDTNMVLGALHDDLMQLKDRIGEIVGRLDGACTPQQVIDRGVGDTYRELTPLRHNYDQLRQAHLWAMANEDYLTWSRSDYLHDDPLASDLAIRNLDDIYPGWKIKSNNIFQISGAPEEDPRPWPSDPVQQLVWFCTSSAEIWVPTISELAELNRHRLEKRDAQVKRQSAATTEVKPQLVSRGASQ